MPRNKDPAVLFYTADFLADTTLWNYEELGRYIKLLCLQHLQDGISEDDFLSISKGRKRVMDKFSQGEDGKFRNKRMQKEQEKRKAYSESRSKNGKFGGRPKNHMLSICKPYEKHSENENINENINSNIYSKYNNVLLTEEELKSLKTDFPKDWSERIERLGEYMASTGKSYESHYATICRWAKEDAKLEKKQGETKYGAFNPSDAMEMALKRSYGGGEYER